MRVRFRAPGTRLRLRELIDRIEPAGLAREVAAAVRRGRVDIDGRRARAGRSPGRTVGEIPVPPGTAVEIELGARAAPARDATRAAGPWVALTPAWPWPAGVLDTGPARRAPRLRFEVRAERDGVAELALCVEPGAGSDPEEAARPDVLGVLASAGFPVLGDAAHGGVLVAGGLRLAAGAASAPASRWWPHEPVFPPERPPRELRVSAGTRRALARGHPWVLRDDETGDTGGLRPGAPVVLRSPEADGARDCGVALVDGPGPVAARLWSPPFRSRRSAGAGARGRKVRAPTRAMGVEARVAAALARRRPLLAAADSPTGSDAFRLVNGEADGLPGLFVDRLGPCLRALVTARACEGFLQSALDALGGSLVESLGPDPPIVQVTHLRERPSGRLRCVQLVRGEAGPGAAGQTWCDGRLRVRERGLHFWVDPGLSEPERSAPGFGLFLDQRENRARLARCVKGRSGVWLNLFAHTGAFSAALLAAGASEVVSVDLSGPYLDWLERNLASNGLDDGRHRAVRGDGRRFLEQWPEDAALAGAIVDPPTAAAAGRRFWSVRRDLEPLLVGVLRRLAPGGVVLVSRNDRGAARGLVGGIRSAAERAGVRLARIDDAPPGVDFPRQRGFPEGDAFHAALVERAGESR